MRVFNDRGITLEFVCTFVTPVKGWEYTFTAIILNES